jgi:uncharacterized SAM-binding protein YcdF (DUF218 family)
MITPRVLEMAQIVWNYHLLRQPLVKADCILVLGSQDTRVAERGAELYLQGWAPLLVLSGGLGRLTKDTGTQPEAILFARIAMEKGVPPQDILVEDQSTNTSENIVFTRRLLQQNNLSPRRLLLVQKPYMERRSYATFLQQWPGMDVSVTSPALSLTDYVTAELPMEKVINMLVGDLQRIKLYAEKGFQAYQYIPPPVWEAYEELVALGFDRQLVK